MQTLTAATAAVLFLLQLSFLTPPSEAATSSSTVNLTAYSTCDPSLHPPPLCESKKNNILYIQGFVPATNDIYSTETTIPAAYAAIDDINANCSILPNYTLHLDILNTKCDASRATFQLMETVVLNKVEDQLKVLVLDGGCSPATEPVAALSGKFYKIPSISLSASSPALSDRSIFPKFFRTIPSEIQSNSARFALMMKYNWRRVATLHQTETIFTLTVDDFHQQYARLYNTGGGSSDAGMEESEEEEERGDTLLPRSFTDDPETPLKQIKDADIRIIMGYFYEDKARQTMCMAYRMNLTTENHIWMFPSWYTSDWYNITSNNDTTVNCTEEELVEAVRYGFYLDSYNFGTDMSVPTDIENVTADSFMKEKYPCYLEEFQNNPVSKVLLDTDSNVPHAYVTFTYDAIWTMAFALDKAEKELREEHGLNLMDFTYFSETVVAEVITRKLGEVSFRGVSGDVSFDGDGSRVGLNGIYQLVEDKTNGQLKLELIAIHDPGPDRTNGTFNFSLEFEEGFPLWKGGLPPPDRRIPVNIYLNQGLVIACGLFTGIAIAIAIGLLVFNLATLWKPLIRDSAPHINTVIIIGCVLMLATCFLLGIDSSNPDTDEYVRNGSDDTIPSDVKQDVLDYRDYRYSILCSLRLWFLTLGFTLSFGALFAKTWQVYHVYTTPKLKKEAFKMWNFLIIMAIFLVVDLVYLSFWTGVFPFRRALESQQDTDNDLERRFEKCDCDNFAYLIGALYVYKGLLVVFGLFLAYESRNVKYMFINDSRFVSISMYIVVILVGIGAPLSLVLADRLLIDAAYSLAVFMIIAACLSCLLILYIPKFVYMAKGEDTMVHEKSQDDLTVSDGLHLARISSRDQLESDLATKKDHERGEQLQLRQVKSDSKEHHIGSDGDSGVLVTGDENETFSSVSTTNGDHQRMNNTTPLPDTTAAADSKTEGMKI